MKFGAEALGGQVEIYGRTVVWAALVFVLSSCSRLEPPKAPGRSPDEVLAAFFSEELLQCTSAADCVTGKCDLSPVFTISTSGGYCLSFSSAFERWQRLELARSLADMARRDGALHDAVLARVREELQFVRPGPEEEAMVELLGAMRTSESLALLRQLHAGLAGEARPLAALALARVGDDAGLDDVVAASFSPVVRVRVHAAAAAGGLCGSRTALGILRGLVADDHHMVRQAAADALAICGGAEAESILSGAERKGTGDEFTFGSARSRIEK